MLFIESVAQRLTPTNLARYILYKTWPEPFGAGERLEPDIYDEIILFFKANSAEQVHHNYDKDFIIESGVQSHSFRLPEWFDTVEDYWNSGPVDVVMALFRALDYAVSIFRWQHIDHKEQLEYVCDMLHKSEETLQAIVKEYGER